MNCREVQVHGYTEKGNADNVSEMDQDYSGRDEPGFVFPWTGINYEQ
jgi:hypothetical protein